MDSGQDVILSILQKHTQISVVECTEYYIDIQVYDGRFRIWIPCDAYEFPWVTAVDRGNDFPHLLYKEIEIRGTTHRTICLLETGLMVGSLYSYEEKMDLAVNQLLSVLSLSPSQQELEYHKEFLVYWNNHAAASYEVEVFVQQSQSQWLKVYDISDSKKRITDPDIYLNDQKEERINIKVPCLRVPIRDSRGIIPPNVNNTWTAQNILNILDNSEIQSIDYSLYSELCKTSYSHKHLLLLFEMPGADNPITFCCEITFANPGTFKLIDKLRRQISGVKTIRTVRCDYAHLSSQIGNDALINAKSATVVGVGSLGSYIASEICKIGFKEITLIDNDIVSEENLLRFRGEFLFRDWRKTAALQFNLRYFHPEMNVTSIPKRLNEGNISELIPDETDILIFAVGSSDVQLECNRKLRSMHFSKPVLFCWLEGNDLSCHVLCVDYSKPGCYECLFTSDAGDLINNKANAMNDFDDKTKIIRNGCGATRVAYGNMILLQATYLVMMAIKEFFAGHNEHNFLLSFRNNAICNDAGAFASESCRCCNDV